MVFLWFSYGFMVKKPSLPQVSDLSARLSRLAGHGDLKGHRNPLLLARAQVFTLDGGKPKKKHMRTMVLED